MYSKHILKSNTFQFFSAILIAGGIDLIVAFLNDTWSWRSFFILVIGIIGIGLRIKTTESVHIT